ncbi:MAG: VCBS repeat-containing protein [Planctomycetota bacterium]|nr:VCBS repeat-containing protein [Planctomycetota bacterium]
MILSVAVTASSLLGGCYGGAALLSLGILELTGDDSGPAPPVEPPIVVLAPPDRVSSGTVRLDYTLFGSADGTLDVRVEYAEVGTACEAAEGFLPATPAAGSPPLNDRPRGIELDFLWDAEHDVGDEPVLVVLRLTPLQDGRVGDSRCQETWAGNSPPDAANIALTLDPRILLVTFDVVDGQLDPVRLLGVRIRVEDSTLQPIPQPLLDQLPETLDSSADGEPTILSLLIADLAVREMPEQVRELAREGFEGEVEVELIIQEDLSDGEIRRPSAAFPLGMNAPPFVLILETPEEELSGSIVPIRYRLFDVENDRANLQVVLFRGDEALAANEFPSPRSSGRGGAEGLESLRLAEVGNPDSKVLTFLWDAGSQLRGETDINIDVIAADRRGDGPAVPLSLPTVSLSSLEKAAELPSGELSQEVVAGDFNNDSIDDVVVANLRSGDLAYFRGDRGFLRGRALVDVGDLPRDLVVGDFDGDGFLDVSLRSIVRDADTGAERDIVSIVRGSSTGPRDIVELPFEFEVTDESELARGDFNGDGCDDLVVLKLEVIGPGETVGSLTLFPGCRETFQASEELKVGASPNKVLSARLDGDEISDVLTWNEESSQLSLFRGRKEGPSLELASTIELPSGSRASAVVVADFEGAGALDVAVACQGTDSVVLLRRVDQQLAVAATLSLGEGARPDGLAASDFDGDGIPEIVVFTSGTGEIVGLEVVAGTLVELCRLPIGGARSEGLVSRDFDGDGFEDLVIANEVGAVAHVKGGPLGLFLAGRIEVGQGARRPVSGDFNRDGYPDVGIAVRQDGRLVLIRGGAGGLVPTRDLPLLGTPVATAAGDFNGDGVADLAVATAGDDEEPPGVSWFRGGGARALETRTVLSLPGDPELVVADDFNGDGVSDLVVSSSVAAGGTISYFVGSGTGVDRGLRWVHDVSPGGGPSAMASGDFDGDGRPELAVALQAESGGKVVYLQLMTAKSGDTGTEGERESAPDRLEITDRISVGQLPEVLLAVEINADEYLDLLVGNLMSGSVTFLRGTPTGLSEVDTIEARGAPVAMTSGDFDADGHLDVVVAKQSSRSLTFLRGNSETLTAAGEDVLVNRIPFALASGDFDGDGFDDVVTANNATEDVSYLRGTLGGPLVAAESIAVDGRPVALLAGNFDGDEFLDVVTANSTTNTVTMLRGSATGLRRVGELRVGEVPRILSGADFNSDGFIDVGVVNQATQSVSYLRQRYFAPHESVLVPAFPSREGVVLSGKATLRDRRRPSRYRLDLPAGAFSRPLAVSVVPSPVFRLPHGEGGENVYFVPVTDTVSLMREGEPLAIPARLSLRSREDVATPEEQFFVIQRDSASGEDVKLTPVVLGDDLMFSFDIVELGTYVVAVGRVR